MGNATPATFSKPIQYIDEGNNSGHILMRCSDFECVDKHGFMEAIPRLHVCKEVMKYVGRIDKD